MSQAQQANLVFIQTLSRPKNEPISGWVAQIHRAHLSAHSLADARHNNVERLFECFCCIDTLHNFSQHFQHHGFSPVLDPHPLGPCLLALASPGDKPRA